MRARLMVTVGLAVTTISICGALAQGQTASNTPPTRGTNQVFRTGVLHEGYNPALPTIFLIGDSTVKNSWDRGDGGLWGWGRPFAAFIDTAKVNVENQALGGTSSRSYISQGHWDRDLALVKKGDYVIMQFGHNDGGPFGSLRGNGDETEEATNRTGQAELKHSYGWYIRKYIADTKAKGATPIVCSLIPRYTFENGKVRRATGSYGTWAAEAAKQGDAQFIDLNGIIAEHYDKLGEDAVKPLFGNNERVHTSWDGAVLNAQCVVEGIKAALDCALNKYLSSSPNPQQPPTPPARPPFPPRSP